MKCILTQRLECIWEEDILNKINQSLRNKGIEDKYVKQSIDKKENEIEPDFVSALKLCKRRRIGPLRPENNRELFYKKDMGILARGGFSFELSKRILDLDAKEFNKLIKLVWFSFSSSTRISSFSFQSISY